MVFRGLKDFSVQPLCSLCLCGVFYSELIHHQDTENTEVAQRSRSRMLFIDQDAAVEILNDAGGLAPDGFEFLRAGYLILFDPRRLKFSVGVGENLIQL